MSSSFISLSIKKSESSWRVADGRRDRCNNPWEFKWLLFHNKQYSNCKYDFTSVKLCIGFRNNQNKNGFLKNLNFYSWLYLAISRQSSVSLFGCQSDFTTHTFWHKGLRSLLITHVCMSSQSLRYLFYLHICFLCMFY